MLHLARSSFQGQQRLEKSTSTGDAKSFSKKAEGPVIEAVISTDNDKVPDDVFRPINPAAPTVPPVGRLMRGSCLLGSSNQLKYRTCLQLLSQSTA